MKCPDCNREYEGKICPYCNDDYQQVSKKSSVSKKCLLLAAIAFVLSIVSFSNSVFMILALLALIINIFFIRKEKEKGKIVFVNILTLVILVISFLSYSTPLYEKNYGYKNIEKVLNVDLPNKKSDDYYYENNHETNIKYIYYKYELSLEEYLKILENENISEYDENCWYIDKVSSKKIKEKYIVYNKMENNFTTPNTLGNCRYMFLQLESISDKYYAHVYDVTIIRKGN